MLKPYMPTSQLRSLGGADEEAQNREEWALARLRFGSTFVAQTKVEIIGDTNNEAQAQPEECHNPRYWKNAERP